MKNLQDKQKARILAGNLDQIDKFLLMINLQEISIDELHQAKEINNKFKTSRMHILKILSIKSKALN